MADRPRRMILAITGASGAVYPRRLLELLLNADYEVHLVISPLGQRLLHDELGIAGPDVGAIAGLGEDAAELERVKVYNYRDVGAAIASGSFRHEGMIVAPCSANTLAAVAQGTAQHLIHRAAHVCLKERRRLVLLHREAPLGLTDIRNMAAVTEAGGIVCPASPGFYMNPRTIDDLVDFVVGRCLDLLEVEHTLDVRWGE